MPVILNHQFDAAVSERKAQMDKHRLRLRCAEHIHAERAFARGRERRHRTTAPFSEPCMPLRFTERRCTCEKPQPQRACFGPLLRFSAWSYRDPSVAFATECRRFGDSTSSAPSQHSLRLRSLGQRLAQL